MNGLKSGLQYMCCLIVCLSLLTTAQAADDTNCERKEKSMISLDTAEDIIFKIKDFLPNCTDVVSNNYECEVKEKALAHLDIVITLISEAKKNYPLCNDPETKDPVTEDPVTEDPVTEDPVTEDTVTEDLVTEDLVTEDLETEDLVTEDPVTKQPVTNQSVTTQSITELPVTKQTVTEEPVTMKPKFRDCSEVLQNGQSVSGVYTIWPSSSLFPNKSLEVFCDMETDGGGWTLVQRRGNFKPQENFYRDWKDYKKGFGNISKDFWLGNDNLFVLSNQARCKIRFDLKSANGERGYALYEEFMIGNEMAKYKLQISKYSGNAGDAMRFHNLQFFSTMDRDNDVHPSLNCAADRKSGWWFKNCARANLNGLYQPGVDQTQSVFWWNFKNAARLSETEIKLKKI